MKGKYLSMDDAYKIANFDKVKEENTMLRSDNYNLKNIIKEKDKHYIEIIKSKNAYIKELEKENSDLKSKQISLKV